MKREDKTIKTDAKGFWGGKVDLCQLKNRKVQDMKKTGIILLAVVVGLMIYLELGLVNLLDTLSNITIMRNN